MDKNDARIDENGIKTFLDESIKHVKVDCNISELKAIKKVYKESVPLFLRSYLASYLIKEVQRLQKELDNVRPEKQEKDADYKDIKRSIHNLFHRKGNEADKKISSNVGKNTVSTNKVVSTATNTNKSPMKTVFIGIGKNKRVMVKDIVGILTHVVNIEKNKIGNIKIYPNYSFVELEEEDAKKAITALNGYEYKRQSLNVDYSKVKSENNSNSTDSNNKV